MLSVGLHLRKMICRIQYFGYIFALIRKPWEAWERLSKMKGEFLYDSTIQMGQYRIHEESETSIIIGDNARSKEDYEMFCKFWPKSIAKVLSKVYAKSEKSNETK